MMAGVGWRWAAYQAKKKKNNFLSGAKITAYCFCTTFLLCKTYGVFLHFCFLRATSFLYFSVSSLSLLLALLQDPPPPPPAMQWPSLFAAVLFGFCALYAGEKPLVFRRLSLFSFSKMAPKNDRLSCATFPYWVGSDIASSRRKGGEKPGRGGRGICVGSSIFARRQEG